jgi:hypothetical protein
MEKDKKLIFDFLKCALVLVVLFGIKIQKANCATPIISSIEITYHEGILLESGSVKKYAYTVNENPYMRVKINSSCSEQVTLLILGKTISGNGLNICYSTNNIVPYYASINIDIPIPNYVTKYNFIWEWTVTAIPNCNSSGTYESNTVTQTTSQLFYVIIDSPKVPMSASNTNWPKVLDYACTWANGQSSYSGVMQKVVEGLYNNTGFLYDVNHGMSRYTGYSTHSFDLTSMLSEIGGSQIVVNCYDMGKAVKIFANALGCNSLYAFSQPFGYLNCIKAIGRGWSNNPFYASMGTNPIMGEDDDYYDGRSGFRNHAFCMFGSSIYDACLKVDTDSNPDAPPHTESWATGWNWDTYKSKVIDNNPASSPGTPYTGYTFSVY